MRPSLQLGTLAGTASQRVLALRELVVERQPAVASWAAADQRAISYAVIEGANLWEGYCRAFYLSSALGAREPSGGRVKITPPRAINSMEDAVTIAVHRMDPELRGKTGPWRPQQEPIWSDQHQLATCFKELQASNLPKLERALGLEPDALNHMRTLRNFFAHKGAVSSGKTASIASRYGHHNAPHPVDFLLSSARGKAGYEPGEVIMMRWFEVLYQAIRLTIYP